MLRTTCEPRSPSQPLGPLPWLGGWVGAAAGCEPGAILCSAFCPRVRRTSLAPRQRCVAGHRCVTGPRLVLTNAVSWREGGLPGRKGGLLVVLPSLGSPEGAVLLHVADKLSCCLSSCHRAQRRAQAAPARSGKHTLPA